MQSAVRCWRTVRVWTRWPRVPCYVQLALLEEVRWIPSLHRRNRCGLRTRVLRVLASLWLAAYQFGAGACVLWNCVILGPALQLTTAFKLVTCQVTLSVCYRRDCEYHYWDHYHIEVSKTKIFWLVGSWTNSTDSDWILRTATFLILHDVSNKK